MSEAKKLICATCAGELILDKERNLYKCPFCGVAYGYALFDGSALDKAEKALSIGEFNDADLYFSFALSTDPKNIRAFRGRVFCAGKWKSFKDFNKTRKDVTGIRVEHVIKRCEEAIKNLSEEQAKYFRLIKEILEITEKSNEALAQGKKHPKKRDEIKELVAELNRELDEYRQTEIIRRTKDSLEKESKKIYTSDRKIFDLSREINIRRQMLLKLNKELFQEDIDF